ncbi:MAG: Uma2 family endonuclease [Cyanobacteria bacterium P01_A01_bin.123]
MTQADPPLPPKETLPTMYDLPSEQLEEPGLPDVGASLSRDLFHYLQPQLLSETFRLADYATNQIFTAGDLNLYYDVRHPRWYKRPDWFAVPGVPRLYEETDLRLSYVLWQEGISPAIIVELLSPGTEAEDLGQTVPAPDQPPTKWQVYQNLLRVPYYITYNRYSNQLRGFTLVSGEYEELSLETSRLWLPKLAIGIGLWQGDYRDIPRTWLRWYDTADNWLPTKAERLAERLRQLGVDPDTV